MQKSLTNKKAFSLVELSIVILIIGIIIAGITQSSRLIAQFRLSSAKTQTKGSPVPSISNLVMWLEPTLDESLLDSEREDTDLVANNGISTWYDLNPNSNKNNATQTSTTLRPKYYAKCINNLPCIRFDGSNDVMSFSGTDLVGTNFTIFVVDQRRAATGIFVGKNSSTSSLAGLIIGYTTPSTINFANGDNNQNAYNASIASYSTPPVARVHSFVNYFKNSDSFNYLTHFINGSAASSGTEVKASTASGSTNGLLTSYSDASIGSGFNGGTSVPYNGDIGEIIIYSKALKLEERVAVEDYLTKKWGITPQ